jgi:hypothetical protein
MNLFVRLRPQLEQNHSRRDFLAASGQRYWAQPWRLFHLLQHDLTPANHRHSPASATQAGPTTYCSRTNAGWASQRRSAACASPVNRASTHDGINGLAAALGNEECYRFAQAHPEEFLFAANEVPDLEGATVEIEKYLKLGAVMIAEQKFGVECDSPEMQKIYELAQAYRVPVLIIGRWNRTWF